MADSDRRGILEQLKSHFSISLERGRREGGGLTAASVLWKFAMTGLGAIWTWAAGHAQRFRKKGAPAVRSRAGRLLGPSRRCEMTERVHFLCSEKLDGAKQRWTLPAALTENAYPARPKVLLRRPNACRESRRSTVSFWTFSERSFVLRHSSRRPSACGSANPRGGGRANAGISLTPWDPPTCFGERWHAPTRLPARLDRFARVARNHRRRRTSAAALGREDSRAYRN